MNGSERIFTDRERARILRQVREGGPPGCPACGAALERHAVPPSSEVAYVRRRRWYVCGSCRRNAVFDEREISRRE